MWHSVLFMSCAAFLMLFMSPDGVDAFGAITSNPEDKLGYMPEQTFITNRSGWASSKFALGPHLAPKTFPHDNPFNLTEEDALKFGIKVIPVEDEHWDALVSNSGLNEPTANDTHALQLGRRDEVNPPDPTDWCTPSKSPGQCTFGTWCHSMSSKHRPNRAWVFYNDCELTGDLHPFQWGSWMNIYSGLPWVTVFYITATSRPTLKYAGREWSNWANDWELYYPYRSTRGIYYYRRYFDCS